MKRGVEEDIVMGVEDGSGDGGDGGSGDAGGSGGGGDARDVKMSCVTQYHYTCDVCEQQRTGSHDWQKCWTRSGIPYNSCKPCFEKWWKRK